MQGYVLYSRLRKTISNIHQQTSKLFLNSICQNIFFLEFRAIMQSIIHNTSPCYWEGKIDHANEDQMFEKKIKNLE